MLSQATYYPTIPCVDFERAKRFYAEKLGLTPAEETEAGAFFEGGDGSRFLLFPSSGAASGNHTQMGIRVDDIDREIQQLKQRGVNLETYDFPGFDKSTGIATVAAGVRTAWVKDSEGNLIGIAQID